MTRALASILEAGFPTALYQLPQVTQNEFSPEVGSSLALRFPNFMLFKDSSGSDRVVSSGKSLGGVFTLREGRGVQGLRPVSAGISIYELYHDVPCVLDNVRRALSGEEFIDRNRSEARGRVAHRVGDDQLASVQQRRSLG